MSILNRNKELFSIIVRERGIQYYQKGKVDITYADDLSLMAEVQGTKLYTVDVKIKISAVCVACTCAYAENYFCKHMYAVLMKIDQDRLLPELARHPDLRLRLVSPDELFDEDETEDDDDILLPGQPHPSASPMPWEAFFDELQTTLTRQQIEHSPAPAGDREVIYILRHSPQYFNTTHASDLVVNIAGRTRKKNGEWGKIKPLSLNADTLARLDGEDEKIISILTGAQSAYDTLRSSYGQSGFLLSKPLAEVVLPLMANCGRLYFQNDLDETLLGPLAWQADEVWTPRLVLKPDESGTGYHFAAELESVADTIDLSAPLMITRQGMMIVGNRICRLDNPDAYPWVENLHRRKSFFIPADQISGFLGKLYSLPGLPALSSPENLALKEVRAQARCGLMLRTQDAYYYLQDKKRFRATLYFLYAGHTIAPVPRARGFYDEASCSFYLRDAEAEKNAHEALLALGFKTAKDTRDSATHEIDADKFDRVVATLTNQGWHVEADGKLYREAGSFSFHVTSGIDWFELDGVFDFENQKAKLPALLAALQKKQNLIELEDGSFGVIPEELLNRYGFLARMGEIAGGQIRFKKSQAGLLDALLAALPQASCDALFENTRRQLQRFDGITPALAPESFQGTLRHYQEEALGWFEFLRQFGFGGCLADDMGLGKTVQVLAMLEKRRLLRQYELQTAAKKPESTASSYARPDADIRPSLVVAPRSVIFNWQKEAARFTPRMKVLDHTGQTRKAGTAHFEDYDLVLTTYGTLRRDAVAFRSMEFDYVILDEAQAIKNADTASSKAVRLLRARHRLALSGTPIENHLSELWSLFEFLNPGLLGSASVFKSMSADAAAATPQTRAMLACALKPFILRRTKARVAPELPNKTEQVIYCEMDKAQARLYNELRDHYRRSLLKQIDAQGMGKSKMHILEALLRLRQAACHPGLLDDKWKAGASAKTEFLLPQLAEILEEGHKALIFSQFTSFLSIVKKQLDQNGHRYLYLDGKTKDRESLVRTFQEENTEQLFLISLRAGGLGLNLTAAEYVYLLDPWWNPAVEAQAIDRTHRIGQTEHVFAYRLITRNTVEERVLELQQSKRDLFAALISEDTGILRNLGREDLEILLS